MTERIRFGCIGVGEVARRFHLPALSSLPQGVLHSVHARSNERAKELTQTYPDAIVHEDINVMLADPQLDAVIITAPDHLHKILAVAAADYGKHMLIEKPLAHQSDGLAALRQLCTKRVCDAHVGFHLRGHAGHQALWQKVKAGYLGDLTRLSLSWSYDWSNDPKESQRQVLHSLGVHLIDFAQWMIGTPYDFSQYEVVEVLECSNEAFVATITIDGIPVDINCNGREQAAHNFVIWGSEAAASGEFTFGPRGGGHIKLGADTLCELPFTQEDPYAVQLQALIHSIMWDLPPQHCATLSDGIWNVEVTEALLAAR